ncbi:MAG: hypothetical protein P4M11_08145 [Candidatus Pacebacteria bacterium]|nr:hypothetical protein [Candidatus Paceibacterota bacterium]
MFAGNASSINDLTKWRINPDERISTRNDLEFYIPQLCGYLIDESKPQELRDQLFTILVQAANAQFYFSHRLYFFLQAYTNDTALSRNVLGV